MGKCYNWGNVIFITIIGEVSVRGNVSGGIVIIIDIIGEMSQGECHFYNSNGRNLSWKTVSGLNDVARTKEVVYEQESPNL